MTYDLDVHLKCTIFHIQISAYTVLKNYVSKGSNILWFQTHCMIFILVIKKIHWVVGAIASKLLYLHQRGDDDFLLECSVKNHY